MDGDRWQRVDRYIEDRLLPRDDALAAAIGASNDAGLPPIAVAPNQGKLLHVLARAIGAARILEIGTLGGYSTIWLARALPEGGRLVTIEVDPVHADVARTNLERAGVSDRVTIRTGRGLDVLPALATEDPEPFDFVFIDADKPSNPEYLSWAVRMTRLGSLVVVDNVVRNGAVADDDNHDPAVLGSRKLYDALAAEPRLVSTAVQTVGVKGYDGFAIALVAG
jgi:predicted O-methyltransferase YrrM